MSDIGEGLTDALIMRIFKVAGIEAPKRDAFPRFVGLSTGTSGCRGCDSVAGILFTEQAVYMDLAYALAAIEAAVELVHLERNVLEVRAYASEMRELAIRYQQEAAHFSHEARWRYATRSLKGAISREAAEELLVQVQGQAYRRAALARSCLERFIDCLSWLSRAEPELT